ncbi:MAG: signal peptidase I [Isosphaeraceae bacterium]|nr:signal peptidase I [Isosphaeraceae bacterium]
MAQSLATKSKPQPQPKAGEKPRPRDSNRDFIEQLVVAFILAFLVRGFEAEAFVIPTGSMAPTLMGRHKEVTCRQCGHVYQVNASEDAEQYAAMRGGQPLIESGVCNNCRFQEDRLGEAPSFKGDRILVMKFLYSLPFLPGGGGPKRWDVVVFHYPEEPETNYIKRCVGLPDEDLKIYFGDILTRPRGSNEPYRLQRKPLHHQQAMQMLVWDDTHRPKAFKDKPDWQRWRSEGWTEPTEGTFVSGPSEAGSWNELRYANLAPDPKQWEAALTGKIPLTPPRATLITDFYAYNSSEIAFGDRRPERGTWYQPHWVGDLTLSGKLEVLGNTGKVRFELIEGGVANRCEIDLATGAAALFRDDQPLGQGQVASGIKGPGTYRFAFANVDNRLTLWINGRTPFGEGVTYEDETESFPDGTKKHPLPTEADLRPAAIATSGGAAVKVSDLVLKRDIYYTQVPGQSDYAMPPWGDPWSYDPNDPARRTIELFDRLSDPSGFAALGKLEGKEYTISPGRYMMLGDNSPRSKDSRGWDLKDRYYPDRADSPFNGWDPSGREAWEVPESLLIGKAFFVYWPHGKPFGPEIRISRDLRLPFRPYFERMKWIR